MSCHDTQTHQLYEYLKTHRCITRLGAVKLGIMNLWARAAELEEMLGIKLDRHRYTSKAGKRVMEYSLPRNQQKKRAA